MEVKRTWMCVCGHPLYRHAVLRLPSKSEQEWGGCKMDGCPCMKGRAETDPK